MGLHNPPWIYPDLQRYRNTSDWNQFVWPHLLKNFNFFSYDMHDVALLLTLKYFIWDHDYSSLKKVGLKVTQHDLHIKRAINWHFIRENNMWVLHFLKLWSLEFGDYASQYFIYIYNYIHIYMYIYVYIYI